VVSAAPRPSANPVAERRIVSILFADLVGFTTLADGRDPEETRELLSKYFDLARDVVERYGGTIEKFIGDAVMAVWGAPTAHEDDAERAVRAGLELVDAVKGLGPEIQARAGVLTGEAAVTIGATNQGMVAGDLVNTASRLQSAATPGAVLVGEATQRAASRAIVFEEAGEQILKGKQAPVEAWRAVRVVAERGGRNRAETLEAPFVGREDELRLLKDLFHATSREKRTRLVSVIGPAGIGKTRLAWEFLKYLDGLVETVWFHDGRSPAYGDGISFWALGEIVRRRAKLLETDDEPTTRAKIKAMVVEHVPNPAEQRMIEPALLALLGVEPSPSGSDQLFAAWRTFFERLAASAPVVLILEDFHYADTGLLDFVDHLVEWSRNVPIYVLTLARPELIDRRPSWGAGKRNFTSLYLDPLPEPAMRQLLAGLVPGLPASAVRSIVERAGGIPLYAVETVRMLLAEGKLTQVGAAYHPTGDLAELAVPETLTALIASRLDGLSPDERGLVSDAAVLGQSFTTAALSAVSGIDADDLEPKLRDLVRRELLVQDADPNSPERGQFAFVQALIREVAYNTLARRDRKTRHLAAARFFEGLGTDELAGALASHYFAAHANAAEGPEADALAAQARIALRSAAERAAALGSYEQAVTSLRQALTVTTDPVEEADLLERAGESASTAGHHEEADVLLRRAVEIHRGRGDRPAIARSTAALGRALLAPFRTIAAIAVLEPAAEEFADLAEDPGAVALLGQLARAYMLNEEPARAVEAADRALAAAELADYVELVADTLITKGTALASLRRGYEGAAEIDGGVRLAEAHGMLSIILRGKINRSATLFESDPVAALEITRGGYFEAQRLGLRRRAIVFLMNSVEAGVSVGEWDWALPELEEWLTIELEPEDRIVLLSPQIQIRAWRGESVSDLIDEVQQLSESTSDPSSLFTAITVQALAKFAEGSGYESAELARKAATLSASNAPSSHMMAGRASLLAGDIAGATRAADEMKRTGMHGPFIEARRMELAAGLTALDGHTAEAVPMFEDVLRRYQALGVQIDQAFTAIEMATLLDPSLPEVIAAGEVGRDILVRLRAKPFIARLDAALARTPEGGGSGNGAAAPAKKPAKNSIRAG
jgi:class 3 adenylate cyclase/tetratricopeptide (TPR) repeat protein